VHLVIDCDPRMGIMKCITKLKGETNRLRDEFPELRTRIPCLWTKSSFIKSIGNVELYDIKKYLEEQK